MNIEHRELIGDWLNARGLTGNAVEIGSAEGHYAASILSGWKGKRLFMVDPWAHLPEELCPQSYASVNFEAWHQACVELSRADNRAVLIRKTSAEAVKDFENWSLDFVYLDGAHDMENVLQDLELWYPKLKPGGLLGGHDFSHPNPECAHNGVKEAVTEWMRVNGLSFTVTRCTSWWAVKK